MADILPFAIGASKPSRPHSQRAGEVVIFPGIRVEYHEFPPEPPKGRHRRAKRDAAKDALSA